MVTFEDGKIVCVQKAKKEGQKSTKVIEITMVLLIIKVMVKRYGQKSTKLINCFHDPIIRTKC